MKSSKAKTIEKKLTLLACINDKKTILFGNLKNTTNGQKTDAWKSIHKTAQALQLATAARPWTFTRDKLYGLWKCRTLVSVTTNYR